jgi:hypothetical protein
MKRIAAACGLIALTACATTPGGLERPEYATAFEVAIPYQLALKNIVDADRECQQGPLLPIGQVIDDVQNYPDLGEAKIVKGSSGFGTQIYQVITVKAHGDSSAEVTLFSKAHREKFAARLKRWAGGDKNCDL